MIIGITINNILRDHLSQLSRIYELTTGEVPISPINPFDLETSFPDKSSIEIVSDFNVNHKNLDLAYNDVDEKFNVFECMYSEASFEIFGRAEESTSGVIFYLNELEKKLKCKIVLLNKESPRSKCATLFFLSKNNFNLKNIIFPDKDKEFWEYVDVLITDNPKILKCKPKDKIAIKINNEFNLDIKADFNIIDITKIKELKKIIKSLK